VIISRRVRFAGHVARSGVRTRACRVLVGKPEGRRPLGRPRLKWEDNIKMDIQEVGWGHMVNWCGSGQGLVGGTCKRGIDPLVFIKCRENFD